jgi:chemotaxis response regulator CheB
MPAEAVRTGAVDQVVGIEEMYAAIEKYVEIISLPTQPVGSR